MAGEAGHHGLLCEFSVLQPPRAVNINRRDKVANASLEVHRVAAQAVVVYLLLLVLRGVEEDVGISRAVATGAPRCELLLVTTLASRSHSEYVSVFEFRLLRGFAAQVRYHPTHVLQVEACVQREHIAMAA